MAIPCDQDAKPSLLARHARACPEHPPLTTFARRKTWIAGAGPAMTTSKPSQKLDGAKPYAASAALAFSAIAWNAAGSLIARSDSTLRSTMMPDFDRPLIKTL